jgi:PKD repeat protein
MGAAMGLGAAIGVTASAAAAPAALPGTVLFDGGVDRGVLLGGVPRGWDGASGNPLPVVQSAFTSSSPYAMRFDVDSADYDGYGDRSEVQGSTGEREGQSRAYRWSVWFPPKAEWPSTGSWQVFGQWHSALDGSPPLGFYVNDWDAVNGQYIGLDFNIADQRRCSGSRKIRQYGRRVWQRPIPYGQWMEVEMYVAWASTDTKGMQRLRINGVDQVFDGPYGSKTTVQKLRNVDPGCSNYYKQGYYRGHTSTPSPVTVFYDNFLQTDAPFPAAAKAASIAASTDTPAAGTSITVRDASPGRAVRRAWDLDDDGVFDDGTGAAETVAFARPGPRYVRLQVTDADGTRLETYRRIRVRSARPGPGRPPTAAITDNAGGAPVAGAMVTFSANATSPDGAVEEWAWDLDGDGFDDGDQPTAQATYTEPGTVTVRVRVADDRGAQAIASRTVDVRG